MANKTINIDTISQQIDNCVVSFFDNYNINIYDIKDIKAVTHNMLNLCFRYIYKQLFKPYKPLQNNQKSLIDYDDLEMLQVLSDKYIEICQHFNKSLGLMSFSFMIGINYKTLYNWLHDPSDAELTGKRLQILQNIQECHKVAQISLLNDSPVGALAVANNDVETGLEWSKNQAAQIGQQAVYLIPSERSGRLQLGKVDDVEQIEKPV